MDQKIRSDLRRGDLKSLYRILPRHIFLPPYPSLKGSISDDKQRILFTSVYEGLEIVISYHYRSWILSFRDKLIRLPLWREAYGERLARIQRSKWVLRQVYDGAGAPPVDDLKYAFKDFNRHSLLRDISFCFEKEGWLSEAPVPDGISLAIQESGRNRAERRAKLRAWGEMINYLGVWQSSLVVFDRGLYGKEKE